MTMFRRSKRSGLGANEDGVAAVEFAMLLPLLLVLFFGGISVTRAINVYRKLTITTRELADLISQYTSMQQSDMTTVMNAAAQTLAPFSTTPLGIVVAELTMTYKGTYPFGSTQCTVTWSSAQNATKLTTCPTLPTSMYIANISYIYAATAYTYTSPIGTLNLPPPFGATSFGSINMADHIYMLPRLSASVAYSGS